MKAITPDHPRGTDKSALERRKRHYARKAATRRTRWALAALFVLLAVLVAMLLYVGNTQLQLDAKRHADGAYMAQLADWCESRGIEVEGLEVYR